MFAALLLAVPWLILPFAAVPPAPPAAFLPVPGAPCVCFPVQHAGDLALPEKPLGKAGWKPERLVDETLRIVRGSDDVFLRAEALRTTLQTLGHRSEESPKAAEANQAARRTLFDQLSADLKRETELAPLSRATIELDRELEATSARLSALPGVARVERAPSKAALIVWFDAQTLPAERLRENVSAGSAPSIQAPNQDRRANAAITLAFAGEASTQMGHGVDFDARGLAREATELLPKDARVLILAGMVWFDASATTSAVFAREALRNSKGDEYARKNIVGIFGVFFDADTLEELEAKLEKRIQRG